MDEDLKRYEKISVHIKSITLLTIQNLKRYVDFLIEGFKEDNSAVKLRESINKALDVLDRNERKEIWLSKHNKGLQNILRAEEEDIKHIQAIFRIIVENPNHELIASLNRLVDDLKKRLEEEDKFDERVRQEEAAELENAR